VIRKYSEYPDYEVCEDGIIFSYRRKNPTMLVGNTDKDGYRYYLFRDKDNKRSYFKAHRLVALLFCDPPENWRELVVNHIDGTKLNNHYTNLEWCTIGENNIHAIKTGLNKFTRTKRGKLTENDVLEIVDLINNTDMYIIDIARKYKISDRNIRSIRDGKNWKHLNYKITRRKNNDN